MSARRIRVAVDARSLLCAQPRGEGKSLLRLYEEIARLRPDIQVLLFGDDRAARYAGPLPAGAGKRVVPALTWRWDLWEDLLFPLRARAAGCTVLHAASSSAPRWPGLPVLMTVHDLIPMVFDDGHDEAGRQRFARRLGIGMAGARAVATVSGHTRRDLMAAFPGHEATTHVVHWGGDVVCQPGPAAEPPTLLVFGGEARRKNTDYAVDRFVAAAQRAPALQLHLVGIGSAAQRERLQQRLAAAGLADRVQMPGFVTEAELSARLRSCCALLYPSLYEGFGLPLLEALGHGVPVLASNLSSLPEVLDGVPGTFDLGDPRAIEDTLVRLATDPAERQAMVQAQRPVMDRFRWADTATRYVALLETLA